MLKINDLEFNYTAENPLFEDFNLEISKEQVCTLIGKSGSGKSTLLKLIFGFYTWQKGTINLNGRNLLGPKGNLVPGEPDIKWVAQDFDLMPYTTVAENVGIYFSNINLKEKEEKVLNLLRIVDLEDFQHNKVADLSGGQKQRVAIAKALAEKPALLLLDEPFSQIDTYLKNKLQRQIFEYVRAEKITVLMVTHHIQDALAFSDRIDVLDYGKIIESNVPNELFFEPQQKQTQMLLGDVNDAENIPLDLPKDVKIVHPFELQVSSEGFEVEVEKSYFKGSHYLIVGIYKAHKIYFNHSENLSTKSQVKLQFISHRQV